MQTLIRRSSRSLLVALVALLLPSAAYAQAAITGVVRDASGGVLPGVTVEAASPVLIEKVRSVVTDACGQYRIVDLRPGTYSVTFELPGFNIVKREGIEVSGSFVATVNADLRVGAIEETITVTGESPIVDVQSARTQQIIDRDIISAIPRSRNVTGIQAMIPGMAAIGGAGVIGNSNTDSGGIGGRCRAAASYIHGGRPADSRIYADGINMGWAGRNGGGGNMPQVASAQEVVMTHVGRTCGCRDQRRGDSMSSPAMGPTRSAVSSISAARTMPCRAAITPRGSRPWACGRLPSSSRSTTSIRCSAAGL